MKITELTATPQLIKFELDDAEIVEKYGDVVEFWAWDKQPLDHYFKMASNESSAEGILQVAKSMILDEDGKPVMEGDKVLPPDVAMKAFNVVITSLGK